jgi:hypothetical protein
MVNYTYIVGWRDILPFIRRWIKMPPPGYLYVLLTEGLLPYFKWIQIEKMKDLD